MIIPTIIETWKGAGSAMGYDIYSRLLRDRIVFIGDPEGAEKALAAWEAAHPEPVATIGQVADHIEHIVKIAGHDHVGIGSDFDGVGALPQGLGGVETYPALLSELMRRGWSDRDIAKLAGENVLRVMAAAEKVAVGK